MSTAEGRKKNRKKQKKKEPEGVFELDTFPQNIFIKIAEKLDFADYVSLENTSKYTADFCRNSTFPVKTPVLPALIVTKKRVVLKLEPQHHRSYKNFSRNIPWAVAIKSGVSFEFENLQFDYWVSSSRLQKLCRLFEEIRTKVESITFSQRVLFRPDDLERLIKATKPMWVSFNQFVPRDFFRKDTFSSLYSSNFENTGFSDEELLTFDFGQFLSCRNDFITAKGLNRFLKQWKRGERKFDRISITYDSSFNTRPFDIILEGLDANPVWTPDLHEQSLIAKLPIQEFGLMETGDPDHIYAIWKSDKIDEMLLIILRMGEIQAFKGTNPEEELYYALDPDQYFDLLGVCKYCLKEECRHRRKYSTHKLRKNWPKVWRTLIFSMRIARWTTIPFHYSQAILNPFRAVNRPKMEEYKRHFHEENPQNWVHRNWLHFEFLVFRT